jgi:DNA helicase II / ATP-dependent DNA helicase PcrA
MNSKSLTHEQQAVVNHSIGRHAKALAVAGSGKTTTMVYRVKHLVDGLNVNPNSIRVLMFNAEARRDFQKKLNSNMMAQLPIVYTFHALAYKFITIMIQDGIIPNKVFWINDKEELIWIKIQQATRQVLNNFNISSADAPDADEVRSAISLWKGSLIPPSRAGYKGNYLVPFIYEEFEKIRNIENALTFDDFIPEAIKILNVERDVRKLWCNRIDHLIVDEYQDVNYGQQFFIELIAGERADLMVVGDDDQTIYEWRGARPNYIIRDFNTSFSNKPLSEYKLSHSFRFGPVIAQASHNLIGFNTNRVSKQLIAHKIDSRSQINIVPAESNRVFADEIVMLVTKQKINPMGIVVLVRMYAQASGIEYELLRKKIPYRVVGQKPFFRRNEVITLINYIKLATALSEKITQKTTLEVISTVNKPSRKLSRNYLLQALDYASAKEMTLQQALESMSENSKDYFNPYQKKEFDSYIQTLKTISKLLGDDDFKDTRKLFDWIINKINYFDHFKDYYGNGEHSYERIAVIRNFLKFVKNSSEDPIRFLELIDNMDSTRGVPEEQQITVTSIFRTKGLEYDYVFIPDCSEGYMPHSSSNTSLIFDKKGIVSQPDLSEALETERRLCYVALTRAKKTVYIGIKSESLEEGSNVVEMLPSRFIEEVDHEATVNIMGPMQKLFSGDEHAKIELLENVKAYGGIKKIMDLLITEYLDSYNDQSLFQKIKEILKQCPPRHFEYSISYPNIDEREIDKKQKLASAWYETVD